MNGRVAQIGESADADADAILVDGRTIRVTHQHSYIALNKPRGYACTRYDPYLPRTVYTLLPEHMRRLFTVGRLDVDTEGLLLMTTDGEWANDIAHPRRHVPKTYLADVVGTVSPEAFRALREGIDLNDGRTHPARARLVWYRARDNASRIEIVIAEGRKRQVRRMLAGVELDVLRLQRVSVGPLTLGDMPVGRWRDLSEEEVASLAVEAAP